MLEQCRRSTGNACPSPADTAKELLGSLQASATRTAIEAYAKMKMARIFRPAKTAMQSGKAKTQEWVLEFEQQAPRKIEPLMGYTASTDTTQQVRLTFPSAEAAEAYCQRRGITYAVQKPHEQRRRRTSYAENFSYNRKTPWTH